VVVEFCGQFTNCHLFREDPEPVVYFVGLLGSTIIST
jgi:hypothetical protein